MISEIKKRVPVIWRKHAKFYYLRTLELIGEKQSPSLLGLAAKLEEHFDPSIPGFFVEVGGNDGVSQSNTYHLERYYGWNGLLIEPIGWLAGLSRKFRKAETINTALGSFEDDGEVIHLEDNDLMTRFSERPSENAQAVSVRPLSSLLDERRIQTVDFFSLDVEGFERSVLAGIDFSRHQFKRILIETKDDIKTLNLPFALYKDPIKLTFHDYYLELK